MNALLNSFGSESAAAALPSRVGDYSYQGPIVFKNGERVSDCDPLDPCIVDYCMKIQHKPFWYDEPLPVHLKDYWKEAEGLILTLTEDSPGLNLCKGAKIKSKRLPIPNNGRLEPGIYGLMIGGALIVARVKADSLPVSLKGVRAVWRCVEVVSVSVS